jgi:hypothetical protein
MKSSLSTVVARARDQWGVDESRGVDWPTIDGLLFARLEREQDAERARFVSSRRGPWALVAATGAAIAVVVAILAGQGRERVGTDPEIGSPDVGGKIARTSGDDPVLVNGSPARTATLVLLGDSIETRGSEVEITRAGLTVDIERNSQVVVRHARGPLVLALEQGAVRARVAPVANGEAFGVDVSSSRVAVHGTVLRVARVGSRADVDLNDGVVSIGDAPRTGPVLGTLVTAPAHVQFTVSDAAGTMTITHDASAVRPPPAWPSAIEAADPLRDEPSHASAPVPSSRGGAVATSPVPTPAPAPARTEARMAALPSPGPGQDADSGAAGSVPGQPVATAEATANDAVEAAVLTCMGKRPRDENVTVFVHTTLYLDIGDDGSVRSARFDPPVAPEVNDCASSAIYRSHFPRDTAVAIPVEFRN